MHILHVLPKFVLDMRAGGYADYLSKMKNREPLEMRDSLDFLAGAVGLEPTTNGFGDRYSTN